MKLSDCKNLNDLKKLLSSPELWLPSFGGASKVNAGLKEIKVKPDMSGYVLCFLNTRFNREMEIQFVADEVCDNRREAWELSFDYVLYDGTNYDQVFDFCPAMLTKREKWSPGDSLVLSNIFDPSLSQIKKLSVGQRVVREKSGIFSKQKKDFFWRIVPSNEWDEYVKRGQEDK